MSKVLIDDPSNERALFYRAKLLVMTNRLPEAFNDFNELLSEARRSSRASFAIPAWARARTRRWCAPCSPASAPPGARPLRLQDRHSR